MFLRKLPLFYLAFLTIFSDTVAANPLNISVNAPSESHACVQLLAANEISSNTDALISHTWLDQKFSAAFLRELRPLSDKQLGAGFGIDPKNLHSAAKKFRHQRPGFAALQINYYIAERIKSQQHQAVIVFIMRLKSEILGFLALSLQRKTQSNLEAWSEYLKVDTNRIETHGISKSFYQFTHTFFPAIGATSERLEAGWSGRPIWAHMGYEFDPEVFLNENGVPVSQLTLIRRNFQRFLSFHHIKLEDLYLERDFGGREPLEKDLENLVSPKDFLLVKYKRGPCIKVQPYIDVDTLGSPVLEHPGQAFSIWDYRPRKDQSISIDQDGKPLSDIAMPTWIGISRF